tara:strand:+ start:192 stop:398 length:207 start_codon:yes stop_codon:yes gene_type:complete
MLNAEIEVTGNGNVPRASNPTNTDYINDMTKKLNNIDFDNFNIGFVDAGIHLRGDIVNILFKKNMNSL